MEAESQAVVLIGFSGSVFSICGNETNSWKENTECFVFLGKFNIEEDF